VLNVEMKCPVVTGNERRSHGYILHR
jgi:hypothetical protein